MIKTSIFKIQITCPGCGNFHAVSGITESENCHNCGRNINVSSVLLDKMFTIMVKEHYMNSFLAGNVEQIGGKDAYRLEYSSAQPYCEECFVIPSAEELLEAINNKKPFKCKSCGHIMPVREADAAVKEFHPNAVGVINDSYGIDAGKGEAGKEAMLVFKCMTCGSGLELTSKTERTIKCGYCSNDNYLPDSIWTKLHPNKETQPLFLLLDLNEEDLRSSVDYFMRMFALKVYEKHFENFVREYFERPFVTDSFLTWLKFFLSAEKDNKTGHGMDLANPQRSFHNNIKLGYDSHPEKLKAVTAEYSLNIPVDLQQLFSTDKSKEVKLALAKNKALDKSIIKKLQGDSDPEVSTQAKKLKTGFLKSLFG